MMHFLPGQRFDCSGCAKCCRSPWQVAVDEPSRRKMVELPIALERSASGAWVTPKRDGACAFLTERNRCSVHEQLGESSKPHTCRQFPFLFQDTPEGVYVGVSLYCSAAQRNQGRLLEAHEETVRALLPPARPASRFALTPDSSIDWATYRHLESLLTDRAAVTAVLLAVASLPPGPVPPLQLEQRAPDPMLAWMETSFVAGLVARLEGSAERPGLLDELLANQPVVLGCLRASELQSAVRPLSWLEEQLERYREALVFRKFLLQGGRTILENLLVLHLTLRVAELYSWAYALAGGRAEPELEDFFQALDRCELDLVTHGQEAWSMSGSYVGFFREQALRSL